MQGQTDSTTATIQVHPTETLVRVQKPTQGLKVKTGLKAGLIGNLDPREAYIFNIAKVSYSAS